MPLLAIACTVGKKEEKRDGLVHIQYSSWNGTQSKLVLVNDALTDSQENKSKVEDCAFRTRCLPCPKSKALQISASLLKETYDARIERDAKIILIRAEIRARLRLVYPMYALTTTVGRRQVYRSSLCARVYRLTSSSTSSFPSLLARMYSHTLHGRHTMSVLSHLLGRQ